MSLADLLNLGVSAAILLCLLYLIPIFKDIAAMLRFQFHGAEKKGR